MSGFVGVGVFEPELDVGPSSTELEVRLVSETADSEREIRRRLRGGGATLVSGVEDEGLQQEKSYNSYFS